MSRIKGDYTFYSKLDEGVLPFNFIELYGEEFAAACLRDVFDKAILPFMISTRFKYRNVSQILQSNDQIKIGNDSKTAFELFELFLFEKIKRNQALNLDFELTTTAEEFEPYLSSKILHLFDRVQSGNYNWKKQNIFHQLSKLTSDYDKKKLGGISTPYSLVQIMIQQLSLNNVTILDPSCGRGIFLYCVKEYLIDKGLTEIEAISRLAGWDEDLRKVYIAQALIDPDMLTEPVCNVLDSLDENMTKKFDIIIGNPPYNKGIVKRKHVKYYDSISGMGGKMGNYAFVRLALDLLSPQGKFEYIMPTNFMVIRNGKDFRKYIKQFDIESIKIVESNVFEDVTLSGHPCIIIGSVQKSSGKTLIHRIFNNREFKTVVDLRSMDIFPLYLGDLGKSILHKVMNKGERLVRTEWTSSQKLTLVDAETSEYRYKILRRPNFNKEAVYMWANDQSKDHNKPKVVVSHIQASDNRLVLKSLVDLDSSVHGNNNYFICKSTDQAHMLKKWFEHPLFNICFTQLRDIYKIMDYNIGNLTMPDSLASSFTDDNLYSYYELNSEEISFVESFK